MLRALYRLPMQIHPLIESSEALHQFVDLIKGSDFIAVDTEFMRENTFWPELCLIQVADDRYDEHVGSLAQQSKENHHGKKTR